MFESDVLEEIKYIVNTSGSYNYSLVKSIILYSYQSNVTLLGLKHLFGFAYYLYLDQDGLKLKFGDAKTLPVEDSLVSEYFLIQEGDDISYVLEKAKDRFLLKLDKCRITNG